MEVIYRKNFKIQVSDVDFNQKLKLSTLFTYMQDMATEHAERLGVGRDEMQKYGVIWVLIRVKVHMLKYPKWNEDIVIETWPEQPNKLEFDRNFIIYDKDNNIIARALTTWVVIDVKSRRLKRSSFINAEFPLVEREKALKCQLGKIKAKGELKTVYKKTVGYSDIDMNEHLNNSKYVDYIMDCFTIDKHKEHFVKLIEVNYVHEALPGESIILSEDLSQTEGNIVYIEGTNEENNKTVFKSQIEFI